MRVRLREPLNKLRLCHDGGARWQMSEALTVPKRPASVKAEAASAGRRGFLRLPGSALFFLGLALAAADCRPKDVAEAGAGVG
jgi:hypothetical protein